MVVYPNLVHWDILVVYRKLVCPYRSLFWCSISLMGLRPSSPWKMLTLIPLDHVLIFGARHLRRVLTAYSAYYNKTRTHLSLEKDAPLGRAIQRHGAIVTVPILSGLHHCCARI